MRDKDRTPMTRPELIERLEALSADAMQNCPEVSVALLSLVGHLHANAEAHFAKEACRLAEEMIADVKRASARRN